MCIFVCTHTFNFTLKKAGIFLKLLNINLFPNKNSGTKNREEDTT